MLALGFGGTSDKGSLRENWLLWFFVTVGYKSHEVLQNSCVSTHLPLPLSQRKELEGGFMLPNKLKGTVRISMNLLLCLYSSFQSSSNQSMKWRLRNVFFFFFFLRKEIAGVEKNRNKNTASNTVPSVPFQKGWAEHLSSSFTPPSCFWRLRNLQSTVINFSKQLEAESASKMLSREWMLLN